MADIAFPPTPVDEETHEEAGRTWTYDASINAWLVLAETTGILTTADLVDEDDMVSDSASLVPSQQSVKAYVDANLITSGVTTVNGAAGVVVLDADDLDDAATTNKFATAAQLTAVDGLIDGVAPVTITGTTDTLSLADHGQVNFYTNDALVTVTLADLAAGTECLLFAAGAAGLTVAAGGMTVYAGNSSCAVYEAIYAKSLGTSSWLLIGGTSA